MNDAAPGTVSAGVLLVDDEPQIRRFLGIALRAQGHRVTEAASGAEALAACAASQPDLVVLDLGLPDMDGADVLRELRTFSQVPVLVLSVRALEAEKVRLLDLGANDYVTKPFGVPELMARVRSLLRARATGGAVDPVYDDGDLHVDLARREVSRGGVRWCCRAASSRCWPCWYAMRAGGDATTGHPRGLGR